MKNTAATFDHAGGYTGNTALRPSLAVNAARKTNKNFKQTT